MANILKSAAVILLLCVSGLTSFSQSLDPKYYVFGTLPDYSDGPGSRFLINIENTKFKVSDITAKWQYPEMKRTEEVTLLKYVPIALTNGLSYCDTVFKLNIPPTWKLKRFYKCNKDLPIVTKTSGKHKVKVWNWKCEFRKKAILNASRHQQLSYLAGAFYRLKNAKRDIVSLELAYSKNKMECIKQLLEEFGCTILSYERKKNEYSVRMDSLDCITFIPTEEIFNLLNEGVESKKRFANNH